MKFLEDLTVIIVTYKTQYKILIECLNSINSGVKIIIVENSKNLLNQDIILSKYPNVKVVCTGSNLGYGNGNNYGLNLIKTNKALILNPDVICDKNFFENIPDVLNEAKDFTIIGCQYLNDNVFMPAGFFNKSKNLIFERNFKDQNLDQLTKVDWVTGCSMLINLKNFSNKEIFDKNYFLYFEEIDLCKSVINKGGSVYTSKKLKIHHLGFKSSIEENLENLKSLNRVREWHWMWSSFYFYKKNYSFFYALFKMIGKLFKSLLKLIFYSFTLQKENKDKYLHRFLGILNSVLNKPSSFREND